MSNRFFHAERLHHALRRPTDDGYEAAWQEMRDFLTGVARRMAFDAAGQEELVQEAALSLARRLRKGPLQQPRALWAYAIRVLRARRNDMLRRREATKRPETVAVEPAVVQKVVAAERYPPWPPAAGGERPPERIAVRREQARSLRAFFRAHLKSDLQRMVAEAVWLDGLTPAEVAGLLGKRPHAVRMVKARALAHLRALPPEARQSLRELLEKDG